MGVRCKAAVDVGVGQSLQDYERNVILHEGGIRSYASNSNLRQTYTAAHYPEQGYRALVVNLGSLLITLYNLAMKVLPAQTRNTTSCYGGNEILGEAVGWENVPGMFKTGATELDMTEEEKQRSGALPWERE